MSDQDASPTKSDGYDDEFESDASPAKKTDEEEASPTKTDQTTPPRSPTPESDSAAGSPKKEDEAANEDDEADADGQQEEAKSSPAKSSAADEDEQPAAADDGDATATKEEENTQAENNNRKDDDAADDAYAEDETPAKQPADEKNDEGDAAHDPNPEETSPNKQTKFAQRKRLPPHSSAVASVTYPGERQHAVADILDPSKPLVKSTKPLTKPLGPSFVEETTAEQRRQQRLRNKAHSLENSNVISDQRNNERKYLKAQQEFEREKRLAERSIYHRERVAQWSSRLAASPLGVDLVADHERIDEEAFVRMREEKRRQALAERRKRRIKNEIIVKALAEVPLLEEARRQKREMLVEERREKALRDVQRVEAIQARKLRDMALMREERQAKLDQRLMNS